MKLRMLAVAAVLAAVALPAQAGDLVLAKDQTTDLSEPLAGTPYWVITAQCAGVFSAAYKAASGEGRADAEEIKAKGVAMLNAAVERLVIDRGLDRKAAMALASSEFAGGARSGDEVMLNGFGRGSRWNLQRSVCLDVYDAYSGRYG